MAKGAYQGRTDSWVPTEALVRAVEQFGIAIGEISVDGRWLAPGRRLSEMLGLSPAELEERSVSEDLGADLMSGTHWQRLLNGAPSSFSMELKHTSSVRGSIWLNCVFCLVPEEAERPRRVLVLLDEISDRKKVEEERKELSNRFIRAQETERTRIARELHDDIGQRLAILRIQMLRAGRAVSDMPDKTHPSIPNLAENVKEIANRITEISHQLHSSHLEYIGLKSAVENACREFEAEYRTRVKYTSERLDAKVDGIIGLCCLRVVQEALHNIGKHSSAQNVEVSLSTSQDHLGLLVIDDGAGFDLEQARLASGIGLISMRERVHMVGGQFEITSVRGEGTRVRASVPLAGPAKSELDGAE